MIQLWLNQSLYDLSFALTTQREIPMALDKSDVNKIAHLARLQIDASKTQDYATDLSNILEFVGQLQAVDTQNIKPMAHPLDATQNLRPDIVTEKNQRTKFQEIAPSTEDGLYLVPKVIEWNNQSTDLKVEQIK